MHFYRGSSKGAAVYFDEGHGRAEAYYTEGHQAVVQVDTWRGGERLSSTVLEGRGALEAWVEGRDLATGEVKGIVRTGGTERAPLRFVEVVVNNPKSLSVVATQDPVVAAALERVMARQADEIGKYLSAVAVTRTGRRGAQVEQGGLEVETARVTHLTSREGDPHRHVHLMLNARVKAPDGTWRGLHSVALRQHIRGYKCPRPPGAGDRQRPAPGPGLQGLFPGGRRRGRPGPGGGGAHVQTGGPGGSGPDAGRGGLAGGPPGPGALPAGGPRLAPPGLGEDPPAQAEAERGPGRAVRAGTAGTGRGRLRLHPRAGPGPDRSARPLPRWPRWTGTG